MSVNKAFLSHSSANKSFVLSIADQLGRQFSLVDARAFETGTDFRNSIESCIENVSCFVLFASKEALESGWVTFEVDEAFKRFIKGHLHKVLVYLIDTSVSQEDLPSWLRSALVKRLNSARQIAREIRDFLDEAIRSQQQQYFYGRTADQDRLQRLLMPADGSPPPRSWLVAGLPGVGRRSLIKHTASNVLNLKRTLVFSIEHSMSIQEIAIELASKVTPFTTMAGFAKVVDDIKKLDEASAVNRALEDVRAIVRGGELPIFLDAGGLIDETTASLARSIEAIIRAMSPNDEAYFALVSSRVVAELPIVSLRIDPLQPADIKALLARVSQDHGVPFNAPELSELAEYVNGYAPSVFYAVRMATDYGKDLVLNDKHRLVQFRSTFFVQHLNRLGIPDREKRILRLLSTYSPLPLRVVGEALNLSSQELTDSILWLRDRMLVTIDEDGYYSIAAPVSEAVNRIIGFSSDSDARGVVQSLQKLLVDSDADGLPRPSVLRVLFRARGGLGEGDYKSEFHYSADVVKLCKEFYDRREYERALSFARVAVVELPQSPQAHDYFVRALIQEELWVEAQNAINRAKGILAPKLIHYLQGFLHRKKGEAKIAIDEYEESRRLGKKDASLSRELAQCFVEIGDLDRAYDHIQDALKIRPDNKFAIDLLVNIATRQGKEAEARTALKRLESLESEPFFLHRAATVELRFGNAEAAFIASKKALEKTNKPTFEMRALLVQAATNTKRFKDAQLSLEELDRQKKRPDIRILLRCRLLNAQGKYRESLNLSQEFRQKHRLVYKTLRRDALAGELKSGVVDDNERLSLESEFSALSSELEGVVVSSNNVLIES